MKAKKAKPRGRPALPATEKKRRNFTFRGTDELHSELAKASALSGRSLSEEIEWRLGQSFFMREVIAAATKAAVKETLDYLDNLRTQAEADLAQQRGKFSDLLKTLGDEK